MPVFNGSVITARSLHEWEQTVTSHDKQDIQQCTMLGQICAIADIAGRYVSETENMKSCPDFQDGR